MAHPVAPPDLCRLACGAAVLAMLALVGAPAGAQLLNEATATTTTPGLVNVATVTATTGDPRPENNTAEVASHVIDRASVTTTVISSADLAIVKTAPAAPVEPGSSFTFAIAVTNEGPSTATDVVVTDPLPAGVGFVAATASAGGSCTTPPVGSSGTVTCTWAGATAVGQTHTVDIVVTAPADPAGGTLENTAVVSAATPDPDDANDSATAAVVVRASGLAIPTLGWPGALALAGLLALAGATLARRHL
jgi:uncharacterized repeat protein (TIGR01451 family)